MSSRRCLDNDNPLVPYGPMREVTSWNVLMHVHFDDPQLKCHEDQETHVDHGPVAIKGACAETEPFV